MIQMDLEQRQSHRFFRPFLVTDHEDVDFSDPFEGFDVNLTGLGFVVDSKDLFLPSQEVSLRVKNTETDEVYCLEGVQVIHLQSSDMDDGKFICGCHISKVTSNQLLAHHRLVMTDAQTAVVSMQTSKLSEFNFVEDGSELSKDEADFQEASLALNLAVSQSERNQHEIERFIVDVESIMRTGAKAELKLADLQKEFDAFKGHLGTMNESTIAFATLAKLLAHTPNIEQHRLAWKTLISDFETRFLTEAQQIAYDFMHQGLSAEEAIKLADEYMLSSKANSSSKDQH
ncbi:hypothetical protein [Hydrogenovibrio marinus]|uniref:PilZ domain-containing protein n=1 Tax=Hydrogenovibrio marinus TaxID=28885 RepID=A0A066ZMF1_HYDMR|nr:hypothetical protein [Hydrogenovibrio marinus]KDN95003.1 hypothetical protein EI16_01440 [Hydrogenovibrio marinus]BBN59468.1 hypothetical protein HVMH_1062 [Hydrogenovibrio marinus]